MKLRTYAMKPMGGFGSGALACVSRTITPWAPFGDATRLEVRHTDNATGWPKGLSEGSTV